MTSGHCIASSVETERLSVLFAYQGSKSLKKTASGLHLPCLTNITLYDNIGILLVCSCLLPSIYGVLRAALCYHSVLYQVGKKKQTHAGCSPSRLLKNSIYCL
ncbi:unnamed protein product [Victoria cruziana]